MKTYKHFINGAYVDPAKCEWLESENPYTGEVWAQVPRGTKEDVDRAVAAAKAAMTTGPFASMTASQRGKMLRKLGDLVAEHGPRLAEIEVRDNGKLLAEMAGQLKYNPESWYYYAGLADKIEGAVVPIDKPDYLAFTTHEPIGVVGALTAWNSPLMFVAWKAAPAIAAGCSIVIKPSEFTSASALEFAALTVEAGFPPGVFNVVAGYGQEAGAANSRAEAEVNSEGLMTMEQPAAMAGAAFQATNISGEFQAVSAPTTPIGSCVVKAR